MPDEFMKYSSTTVSRTDITNHFIPPFNHFRPHRLSYFLEYAWFRKQCYWGEFDLIHSSYYNLSKACIHLISSGIPHILTVHDTIHELFDELDVIERNHREKILENAKAIIAVSENTRKDLIKIYKSVNPDKVHVIHHGLRNSNIEYPKNNVHKVSNNFILYVGHREGYKNFEVLLPILQNIINTENIILKVVGPPCTKQEKYMIRKYNLENYIKFYSQVSDDKLKDLYLNCLALIYPSLYEGFGYPLIESMSYGAIPIALNIASIPEVLGNAGIIVKSDNINEIEYEIKALVYDLSKRTKLKFKSFERAKYFSIKKNINKTMEIYNKALSI